MEDLPTTSFAGKRITVMGLGRFGGGIAVARFLVEQGAQVLVTDKDPADALQDSIAQLADLPITYRLGKHLTSDFTSADLIVTSPAVAPTNEFLAAATAAGVPITTEICLFASRCQKPVIAVTGTKGKSTTTALLSLMLGARHKVWTGGNIGKSLLSDLGEINSAPTGLVLLEVSSFMLHYLGQLCWSPHIAVITNVTADHLDWHGGQQPYVDAKRQLIAHQSPADHAVLNRHDPISSAFTTRAKITHFPAQPPTAFDLLLPGPHNQLNAQAAFAAASLTGVTAAEAQAAIAKFPGLPHRLELAHTTASGIRFVNDSIATNPSAAVAALLSFPEGKVLQIVGGYDKQLDMSGLTAALKHRAKAVLTIGDMAETLAAACQGGTAAVSNCATLDAAIDAALKLAAPGDVILLSTGCASYDQFTNFEHRGQSFTSIARKHP
jgi:UDP-N-acetylmuramoylalanine--D-glutamate ligase